MTDQVLTLYTIYDHPDDYPNYVVVGAWMVTGGTGVSHGAAELFDDVDSAREALSARGLYKIDRDPNDDPKIVEVWL